MPDRPATPPSGAVTFLFTDIQGSTQLWERYAAGMPAAHHRQEAILRDAIAAHGGWAYKQVGDAIQAAFQSAPAALAAAVAAQRTLVAEDWAHYLAPAAAEGTEDRGQGTDDAEPVSNSKLKKVPAAPLRDQNLELALRVRMALHTGTTEERGDDYVGPLLNRLGQVMAAAHGGQILLTGATCALVRAALPPGVELRDLGERRLKDLVQPEHIWQVAGPGLPASFPPLLTLDSRPHNLPRQPTTLIGREAETAALATLLRRPAVALVTLTGPGGTGKTRLALQLAAALLDECPDGAWFVELAPITDAGLVASAIARVLAIKETPDQPLADTLRAALRARQLLLVLDNFEQVGEAAPLVAGLLAAAPHLKVLVTSRGALHIPGEHLYAVPPLPRPDPARLPPLPALAHYPAVRLFAERAGARDPEFRLSPANALAVAEICWRLDGLPLGIELAAARVRDLSVEAIRAGLDDRLALLVGGPRDRTARQRTLRGAIDWSHALLSPAEQQLFRRLAVFQGGRTVEAVATICGGAPEEVAAGLAGLLSQSLLQQRTGSDDTPRYWMLETIHDYAREKLAASGEADRLCAAHLDYFLALVQRTAPELEGPGQGGALARLDDELGNLRAAIAWALERGQAEQVARIGGALWGFIWTRGYLSEGRRWLEAALRSPMLPPAVRARALQAAGILAHDQGDYARAETCFTEALALRRRLGEKDGLASALNSLGVFLYHRGDYPGAQAAYAESLALLEELHDEQGLAIGLNNLGVVAERAGDYRQAEDYYVRSLALAERMRDTSGTAWALDNLGHIAYLQGDPGRAVQRHRASLALFQELGDKQGLAVGLEHLAGALGVQARPEAAARLFGAAEALREATGAVLHPANRESYDRRVAAARAGADPAAWAAAWATGRASPLDQILAEVVAEKQPLEREDG